MQASSFLLGFPGDALAGGPRWTTERGRCKREGCSVSVCVPEVHVPFPSLDPSGCKECTAQCGHARLRHWGASGSAVSKATGEHEQQSMPLVVTSMALAHRVLRRQSPADWHPKWGRKKEPEVKALRGTSFLSFAHCTESCMFQTLPFSVRSTSVL